MQLYERLALTYRLGQVGEEHVVGEVEELERWQREERVRHLRKLVRIEVEVLYSLNKRAYMLVYIDTSCTRVTINVPKNENA